MSELIHGLKSAPTFLNPLKMTLLEKAAKKYPNGIFSGNLSEAEKRRAVTATRESIKNGVPPEVARDFGTFGLVLKPADEEAE
ncbi:MAG: hypothetical protein ABIH35_02320 [Patescibacteria group bacterium]